MTIFERIRSDIIGYDHEFVTPFGTKRILYADWTATGRMYAPIERTMTDVFGPFVGNTHSASTITGSTMTEAYSRALEMIKHHVHAGPNDTIVSTGSGMTAAVNKLQRIMGLRVPDRLIEATAMPRRLRPVVFVTHMEHHSNHTSWLETIADVICLRPDKNGMVDPSALENQLTRFRDRELKIAAITACSNVTGIQTPYRTIARIMHQHGGLCFVDFACSAPYVNIDMHPENPDEKLDAIYFSAHKFLGGPGTPGILIFDSAMYTRATPDRVGGGIVHWTNPWNERRYVDDIQAREDAGTPAFLQTIKAALAIALKETMGADLIVKRDQEHMGKLFSGLRSIGGLHILAEDVEDRLGIMSFYIDGLHYNLGVRLLNDRFGIQARGGCSCAGTYGHFLLGISRDASKTITDRIDSGDFSTKPGWIRISVHPVMSDGEIQTIIGAVCELAKMHPKWAMDYVYDRSRNEFFHKDHDRIRPAIDLAGLSPVWTSDTGKAAAG